MSQLKKLCVKSIDFYQNKLSKYTIDCPHKEGENCSNLVKDNFSDEQKNFIESIKSSTAVLLMCGLQSKNGEMIDRQKIINDEYKKHGRFRYALLGSIFKNRIQMALSKTFNEHTNAYVLHGIFGDAFLGSMAGTFCGNACSGGSNSSDSSCTQVGCAVCLIGGCLFILTNK